MERLEKLYLDYDEKYTEVRKKSNFFNEFIGIGGTVKNHPCHTDFHDGVLAWIAEFVAKQPTSEETRQVCDFLLETPIPYREKNNPCHWFMYVCVGSIQDLVPFMNKADCAAVADKLGKLYKKRERMPVQDKAYKMLLKAAK